MDFFRKRGIRVSDWYYPVVLAVYLLAMFMPAVMRPGAASALMVLLTAGQLVAAVPKTGLHNPKPRVLTEDTVMLLWLLFNLLSGIWCIFFGTPVSVFLGEVFTTALPMCFYYCGRMDRDRDLFPRTFLISVALTGLIGIILFISGPGFYIDHLMRLELISKADVPTMRVRMHSVIGSTLMGFLPSVGMLVSVRMIVDSKEKKEKLLYVLSFVFMLFLSFMSNQRSAMAASIFIIIYLNFLIFFVFKLFPKKLFAAECGLIVLFTAGFFLVFRAAFMKVYYRLVSLPGSIAQRSDQWVGAANNMKSIWLGNGLGANGHRAIGYTEHLIADGGIAKLYVESGIIGTSVFVFLMLLILSKSVKCLKETAPEAGIVIITLLMSVGSNMMSFALSVPVFYYYAGSCVSRYEKYVSEEAEMPEGVSLNADKTGAGMPVAKEDGA
ncbi:MAG: O-antigen ligase family protein [Lachnospiraceae bacterium]|nr:O-antigen ligase family protein [Lachnospiraceae bacterium]